MILLQPQELLQLTPYSLSRRIPLESNWEWVVNIRLTGSDSAQLKLCKTFPLIYRLTMTSFWARKI